MKHIYFGINKETLKHSKPGWIYWILFAGSFADASVWPFPVATLFIAVVLVLPEKSGRIILVSTIGTLLGAIAGYLTGRFVWIGPEGEFTRLAMFTFNHVPGFSENLYEKAGDLYSKWHNWILFLGSFTPIPFGAFTVSSGVFERPFLLLCLITLLSHILKYSLLSALSLISVKPAVKFLKSRKEAVLTVLLAITALITLTALMNG